MRGQPYSQASRKADGAATTNDVVAEALAIQAARRPASAPPKELRVTPPLPRMRKNRRNKR